MANQGSAKSFRACDGNDEKFQLSNLPSDAVGSIAEHVSSFVDYVRFDSVVRHISAGGSSRKLQMLRSFPWLVVGDDEAAKFLCFFSGRVFFPVKTPVPPTGEVVTRCVGSCSDWLVMADTCHWTSYYPEGDLNSYLLNPCTNRRIRLPPFSSNGNKIVKVVSSSSSSPVDDSGAVLAMRDEYGCIGFCRLGDERWSFPDGQVGRRKNCDDILFFRGVLYGVNELGEILTFDFGDAGGGGMRVSPFPLERHAKFDVGVRFDYNNFFLLESDGEIWLIVKDCVRNFCHNSDHGEDCLCDCRAVRFSVFAMDLGRRRWVELTSLGSRALVVDWTPCCVSLDVGKFGRFGFRANCVYFTECRYPEDYRWHEFCLEDGGIVPWFDFSIKSPFLCSKLNS